MNADKIRELRRRVIAAAESALTLQGYVSAIDVLIGIGWLPRSTWKRWESGRLPYLEQGIQTNVSRISEALGIFQRWASEKQLDPRETAYVARTPARSVLQFSQSGDAAVELLYRTHWLSPDLSAKKRASVDAKANRPPELVAIQPLNRDWKCHSCGGSGGLLVMEDPGPACLACAGLGSLEFLPAGDAALSRRAKAKSRVYAVVVRFSRSRKRYERQGLLVQPDALEHDKPKPTRE